METVLSFSIYHFAIRQPMLFLEIRTIIRVWSHSLRFTTKGPPNTIPTFGKVWLKCLVILPLLRNIHWQEIAMTVLQPTSNGSARCIFPDARTSPLSCPGPNPEV
jgi:hypothetical protein